jgi:hypothetical protein
MKYVAQVSKGGERQNNFLLGQITDTTARKFKGDLDDIPIKYIYFAYSDMEVPPYLVAYEEPDGSTWGIAKKEIFDTFEQARLSFFNQLFA